MKAELSHDGAVVPGEVEDHGDGTYTITLTSQTACPHQLLITMDGQHVQNSPCDLDVGTKYSTLCNPEQVILDLLRFPYALGHLVANGYHHSYQLWCPLVQCKRSNARDV